MCVAPQIVGEGLERGRLKRQDAAGGATEATRPCLACGWIRACPARSSALITEAPHGPYRGFFVRLVRCLDHELGAADGGGKLGFLPGELELVRGFHWNVHAVPELQPNGPLAAVLDAVHDVDGQPRFVEDIVRPQAVHREAGGPRRQGAEDQVPH